MNDELTFIPEFPAHEIKTLSQAYLAFCQNKHPLSVERCLHHQQPVARQLLALAEDWQIERNEASWITLLQCIQSIPDKSRIKQWMEDRIGFKADLTRCVMTAWPGTISPEIRLKQLVFRRGIDWIYVTALSNHYLSLKSTWYSPHGHQAVAQRLIKASGQYHHQGTWLLLYLVYREDLNKKGWFAEQIKRLFEQVFQDTMPRIEYALDLQTDTLDSLKQTLQTYQSDASYQDAVIRSIEQMRPNNEEGHDVIDHALLRYTRTIPRPIRYILAGLPLLWLLLSPGSIPLVALSVTGLTGLYIERLSHALRSSPVISESLAKAYSDALMQQYRMNQAIKQRYDVLLNEHQDEIDDLKLTVNGLIEVAKEDKSSSHRLRIHVHQYEQTANTFSRLVDRDTSEDNDNVIHITPQSQASIAHTRHGFWSSSSVCSFGPKMNMTQTPQKTIPKEPYDLSISP